MPMNERRTSRRKSNKNNREKIEAPYITTYESPWDGLSFEERKELMAEIGNQNSISLRNSITDLLEIIQTYNPLSIMCILANYYLSVNVNDGGVDLHERERPINQPQIEIFQALSLKVKEVSWGKRPAFPDVIDKVVNALQNIISSFSLSRMRPELLDLPSEEQSIIQFQEMIRGHTSTVRYWGYFNQVITILTELYSPFDKSIKERFGFSITDAVLLFKTLVTEIGKLMTERHKQFSSLSNLKSIDEIVRKYYEDRGADESDLLVALQEISREKMSRDELLIGLISFDDINLYKMFQLSANDLSKRCGIDEEVINRIIEYFSLKPGDLENREVEYFFLDNPVWNKPILKVGEEYYCVVAQLFFGSSFFIFDSILSEIDKDSLHSRKSKYLEQKIEEIVKRRFPELQTVSKTKWIDGDREYETDLITFIDSYAIIIEAKSAKVSKAGLRGAPERVKRHINDLIVEPSNQSKRLENKLRLLISKPEIADPLREKLPVDLSTIHRILRISVSLEDFATVQSNLNRFKDTSLFPEAYVSCPTLNLADFEIVFDLLDHPVQILHYFERRTELERDKKVDIFGDELDYLGFYLSTLLSQGYVYKTGKDNLVITSMSAPIDQYYHSRDLGKNIPKPKPNINEMFKNIFSKLEERSIPRWTEIGVALNMFTPDDQGKIENAINNLKLQVKDKWDSDELKNMIIYAPPIGNEFGLAYVLFKNSTLHRKYEFIESAASQTFQEKHVVNSLVIAKNIDDDEVPYHYMAMYHRS